MESATDVLASVMEEKKNVVIIPLRDREAHLSHYLETVQPLLHQYLEGTAVLVVEQSARGKFNKGCILNVASDLLRATTTPEFIFHQDVDTIPTEKCVRTLYTNRGHDIVRITCAHSTSLGGVVKLKPCVMHRTNGFPNDLWGWGLEDRIFYFRCALKGVSMSPIYNRQPSKKTEFFTLLPHISNARRYVGERAHLSAHWKRHPTSPESRAYDFVNGMDSIPEYKVLSVRQINACCCRVTVELCASPQ